MAENRIVPPRRTKHENQSPNDEKNHSAWRKILSADAARVGRFFIGELGL
jgi:hypothetical protein